jgi:hypothetical protein
MNHMPYQGWIFEDRRTLDKADISALQSHLADCAECSALAEGLQQVEQVLRAQPLQGPTEGFTLRWQQRLEISRQQAHRRQIWLTLLVAVSGGTVLLGALAFLLWPWLKSLDLTLWAALYQVFTAYLFLSRAGEQFLLALVSAAKIIPLPIWALSIGVLCQLGVLWVVSFRLLTNPRRIALK